MKIRLTLLNVICLGLIVAAVPEADAGCRSCKQDQACASCQSCSACQAQPACQSQTPCGSCGSAGCGLATAAVGCCGPGMGLAQVGSFAAAGHFHHHAHHSRGLTGYEGLPNMDGHGVHGRYPYHSYRRPWAHPGPMSTNITIVW